MKKKINIGIIQIALLMIFATMLFVAISCEKGINYIALAVIAIIMTVLAFILARAVTEKFMVDINEEVLENARLRQEFTANVTHELKTPLTSISGYAELIENGMASETDVKRFAQGIHTNANRLIILINDIIRLSELDSADDDIDVEELDLYAMATTCVGMLEPSAEKHHVNISASGEKCLIQANKMMMEELLYNLCDNAIRYNNANGNVEVNVKKEKEQVVLSVKDTGIGISKEHQERIFERFYRVDKSRSKSTGGTGLGLAIVKHIIVKHHAKLQVESEVGKGTVMKVIFGTGKYQ